MSVRSLPEELIIDLVDRCGQQLRQQLTAELRTVTYELPSPTTPAALASSIAAVRSAAGQSDALRALLTGAEKLGTRAALFVVKQGAVECWEALGFDTDFSTGTPRGSRLDAQDGTAQQVIAGGRVVHAGAGSVAVPQFGQSQRPEALLLPLRVQDKTAAILYCDGAEANGPALDRAGLEALIECCGMAIERQVALRYAGMRQESSAAREGAPSGAVGTAARPTPEYQSTGPSASNSPVPRASAPGPSGPVAIGVAPAQRTVEPAPAVESSPEIEDARRFARLLLEEIYLYHSDQVEQGRVARDLMSRLGDEIDKARLYYEERVTEEVRSRGDFFREAMVRVLAGGDAGALGEPARLMR